MNKESKKWLLIGIGIFIVVVFLVLAIVLLHFDVIKFLTDPMTILITFVLITIILLAVLVKISKK